MPPMLSHHQKKVVSFTDAFYVTFRQLFCCHCLHVFALKIFGVEILTNFPSRERFRKVISNDITNMNDFHCKQIDSQMSPSLILI